MASIGAGAIRAGRAFVELFTKNGMLYRGLDQARKRVEGWAAAVSRVGIRAGIAGTAVVAPVLKMLGEFAGRGAAIKQIADRLGTTTESVSRLAYGFELAGGNLEEFGGVVDGLVSQIADLERGASLFSKGFASGPLTGDMLIGKDLDTQLDIIAEKFKTIVHQEDQVKEAARLGLSRLLPFLKEGKAGLDKLRGSVPKDGIIGGEEARQSEELVKAANRAWLELRTTFFEIAQAVLPAADASRTLSEQVGDLGARVRAWIKDNGGLIVSVAAVGAGLVAGGIAMKLFGTGLGVVATSLGVVAVAVKGLGVALTFLAGGPIGLAVAAVAGLGVVLATQTETGREMTSTLGGLFTDLGETASTAWGGIVAALKSGDLEAAGEIAMLGLSTAWAQIVAGMTDIWNQFKRAVVDTFRDIKAGFQAAFSGDVLGRLLKGQGVLGAVAGSATADDGAIARAAQQRQAEVEAAEVERAKDLFSALVEAEYRAEALAARAKAAVEQAAAPKKPGAVARETLPAPRLAQLQDELKQQMAQLYAAAKGGFGGPVMQQFGYGDNIAKRQLDAAQNTAQNTAVLPAIDRKVAALGNALVIGK